MHLLTSFTHVKFARLVHSVVKLAYGFCVGIDLADSTGHRMRTSQYHMAYLSRPLRRSQHGAEDQHRDLLLSHFEQFANTEGQNSTGENCIVVSCVSLPQLFFFIWLLIPGSINYKTL